jgi:hypothetical protein
MKASSLKQAELFKLLNHLYEGNIVNVFGKSFPIVGKCSALSQIAHNVLLHSNSLKVCLDICVSINYTVYTPYQGVWVTR